MNDVARRAARVDAIDRKRAAVYVRIVAKNTSGRERRTFVRRILRSTVVVGDRGIVGTRDGDRYACRIRTALSVTDGVFKAVGRGLTNGKRFELTAGTIVERSVTVEHNSSDRSAIIKTRDRQRAG